MKRHPYLGLQDFQFWKRSFDPESIGSLDPVSGPRFTINSSTKVMAAGSCFAQHLARHIQMRGFNFLRTENAHSMFVKRTWDDAHGGTFNYESFSARYGNVYTARQLRQLVDRAYGRLIPISDVWHRSDGMYADPFRPQVEIEGYVSPDEVRLDRAYHLVAVQEAIEKADVFVFTLGLTETWLDKRDGAVFPLAPGVAGGVYDPSIHAFKNFNVTETVEDMLYAIDSIRAVNPNVRVLLTVSPVPLNATYEPRHVLQSTVYSKSVLRVAAQEIFNQRAFVDYFPSFEIITSPHGGGKYFGHDMRSIEEMGVKHVMDVFFSNYAPEFKSVNQDIHNNPTRNLDERHEKMEHLVELLCDEEAIDNANSDVKTHQL